MKEQLMIQYVSEKVSIARYGTSQIYILVSQKLVS